MFKVLSTASLWVLGASPPGGRGVHLCVCVCVCVCGDVVRLIRSVQVCAGTNTSAAAAGFFSRVIFLSRVPCFLGC